MQEVKSTRSELCGQMAQLSDRLSKIECVISKIYEIDKIIPKVLQIEENAAEMKESLNSRDTRVGKHEIRNDFFRRATKISLQEL